MYPMVFDSRRAKQILDAIAQGKADLPGPTVSEHNPLGGWNRYELITLASAAFAAAYSHGLPGRRPAGISELPVEYQEATEETLSRELLDVVQACSGWCFKVVDGDYHPLPEVLKFLLKDEDDGVVIVPLLGRGERPGRQAVCNPQEAAYAVVTGGGTQYAAWPGAQRRPPSSSWHYMMMTGSVPINIGKRINSTIITNAATHSRRHPPSCCRCVAISTSSTEANADDRRSMGRSIGKGDHAADNRDATGGTTGNGGTIRATIPTAGTGSGAESHTNHLPGTILATAFLYTCTDLVHFNVALHDLMIVC